MDQRQAFFEGKRAEEIFRELTGATEATHSEDRYEHTDCWLGNVRVDVKGLKRSSKKGYILVEFVAVDGRKGWCSPEGADMIAFQTEEGFIVVKNSSLYKMARHKWRIKGNGDKKVTRKNGMRPEDGHVYTLLGRQPWRGRERKDVFMYVPIEDVLKLPHTIIGYDGEEK